MPRLLAAGCAAAVSLEIICELFYSLEEILLEDSGQEGI
jgi:hypothetical protein